jgi:hypothetical protein
MIARLRARECTWPIYPLGSLFGDHKNKREETFVIWRIKLNRAGQPEDN